jgi:hypothetical protein
MPRALAIVAGLAGLTLLPGCADLMQQTAISQIAPEWFEEKAVEVKGEGYPELADIPEVRPFDGTMREWKTQAAELKTSADKLEAQRANPTEFRTPEEIRASAAQWRALAEGLAAPPAATDAPG